MDKETAKRYLISVLALLFVGAAIIFSIMVAIKGSDNIGRFLLLSSGLSLIPSGSFAGFLTFFLLKKELTGKEIFLIVFFFPLFLAFITIFGIIMIIPSIIKSIKALRG